MVQLKGIRGTLQRQRTERLFRVRYSTLCPSASASPSAASLAIPTSRSPGSSWGKRESMYSPFVRYYGNCARLCQVATKSADKLHFQGVNNCHESNVLCSVIRRLESACPDIDAASRVAICKSFFRSGSWGQDHAMHSCVADSRRDLRRA